MFYALKIAAYILLFSQPQLLSMQQTSSKFFKYMPSMIRHVMRTKTPEQKFGLVIGTTYIVTTYLMLPAALYYCEKNGLFPISFFSRRNYMKKIVEN